MRSWDRSTKTASLSDFNHHLTLVGTLGLWTGSGGSGGNDYSEGNLPDSHEPASRALCKAALRCCSGRGLAWLWLFPEYAVSPLLAATEGLRAAELGSGQPRFILTVLACLSPGFSSFPCHWVGLLPLCTPFPACSLLNPHIPEKGLTN